MIGDCPDAVLRQFFDQRLRTVTAHAVDNSAFFSMALDEFYDGFIFFFRLKSPFDC
jgi:hypothetical protein